MSKLCIIPARAIKDPALTDTDIRLLCAIGLHTNGRGENCFAASTTLSKEARISRSTFFVAVARLVEAGYVLKTKRKRSNGSDTSSVYSILLDEREGERTGWTEDELGGGESGQPDSRGPDRLDPPRPDRLDPHNVVLNDPSPSPAIGGLPFLEEGFQADFVELDRRVTVAGGSMKAWEAELCAALQGMHSATKTPAEISQAIRDFNAAGADCSLRLFRGYLRGNGAASGDKAATGQPGARANGFRRGGKVLAATELVQRLKKVTQPNPYGGGMGLGAGWQDGFTPLELRVIKAIGTARILNDVNEGTLVSQLAKALEEAE